MQDKETVDDAEEALTTKTDVISDRQPTPDKKDAVDGRRESTKDGKFGFRKMKQPKKEKSPKKSASRYEGEGVIFKAKLIGVESVTDARGDKMCQDAMQRLKLNVRNTGPHKRKINICVSLQGIKIKDEKFGNEIFHHPVSLISFISQDITDARAFGYVFGSTSEPHRFIAIKTEKPAFHVVLALRDLFQTVLNHKQEEIENVKEQKCDDSKEKGVESEDKKIKEPENSQMLTTMEDAKVNDNIYFEVLFAEPILSRSEIEALQEPVKTVDDLIGIKSEMSKLQEGINQMDTSIAAVVAFNTETLAENDPFDTSFVLGPKRDSFPLPMPTPVPVPLTTASESQQLSDLTGSTDKYAVFSAIDATCSTIFQVAADSEASGQEENGNDAKEVEEENLHKTAPPKPPRISKSPDMSVFADLDPLGKDRPYKDKTEFFQDVKNPPKKVLNDLVDPSKETSKAFDANALSTSVPFPVDFVSMSPPSLPHSTPLSNGFSPNLKLPYTPNGSTEKTYNPFKNTTTDSNHFSSGVDVKFPISVQVPQLPVINGSAYSGKSPPITQQQLTVNGTMANLNNIQLSTSSSPIPIPSKEIHFATDGSFSNGSISSMYSKSPNHYSAESPNNSDYYISNYLYLEGSSPTGLKNGLGSQQIPYTNGNNVSPNNNNHLTKQNINSFLNSTTNTSTQNGVSRPRPRPSLTKGGSIPNGGRTVSSHSLSSDSSSDYEAISRENMQSIANVLLTNGHRLRAQSLCLESSNEFKLKLPNEKNIFAKKADPFADDDFFFSLPKKNHLTKAEIPEYV